MTITEQNIDSHLPGESEPALRDLFLFASGNRVFGVLAEEVEGMSEAKPPAPLPHAPAAILGIVYARGRMLTILDPVGAAGQASPSQPPLFKLIISLRGDEQLALAADSVLETITISASDIELPATTEGEATAITGILLHGGQEITILDPARLFDAAVHRRDRRRRRF